MLAKSTTKLITKPNKYTFYERDLSWLQFNDRVLQEVADTNHPLLERLKFLGIFSNNRDEFFRVRVATLKRIATINGKAKSKETHYTITELLGEMQKRILAQQQIFEQQVDIIFKELKKQKIFIKTLSQLSTKQKSLLEDIFEKDIKRSVIPIILKGLKQFPHLNDKSLYLACALEKANKKLSTQFALIEVPVAFHGRFIELPDVGGKKCIVLLEDVIRANMPNLFGQLGFKTFNTYLIKITRDAELDIDNDVDVNVVNALQKSLKKRRLGNATRFVYDKDINPQLLNYLKLKLQLGKQDNLIAEGRIIQFKDFIDFPKHIFGPEKEYIPAFHHPQLPLQQSCFKNILKQDILLHTPYHKFDSIIDLLREAAIDPKVTDIHISCYRLARQSKIIHTLIQAKRNGKNVTVAIEIRARFDESANLNWKNILEEEGIQVVLGPINKKVHAKICVIQRTHNRKKILYGFIGTGNLNENTAKVYTDTFLLTAKQEIMLDVLKVFNYLKLKKHTAVMPALKNVIASPTSTRKHFTDCILQEIKNHKKGLPAGIKIKLNSLSDTQMITKLYEAAQVGVPIQLIVRGICCLVPQQANCKTPIEVKSIVDSYLEHTRYFIFNNNGHTKSYVGSADWMMRNLDHRVEITTPIVDKKLAKEIEFIFDTHWKDNIKARIIDNAQNNIFVGERKSKSQLESQENIYFYLKKK
jgi:polyphosphate kinase